MRDYIVSGKTGETFAEIEIEKDPDHQFGYQGTIIQDSFPDEFTRLLEEFNQAVNEGSFGVLDEIEKKIYDFEPKLKNMNLRIYDIIIDNSEIQFFSKYPTGKGFLDSFPGS